jgi:hypothetical protein
MTRIVELPPVYLPEFTDERNAEPWKSRAARRHVFIAAPAVARHRLAALARAAATSAAETASA